jgi:hypothetical protein
LYNTQIGSCEETRCRVQQKFQNDHSTQICKTIDEEEVCGEREKKFGFRYIQIFGSMRPAAGKKSYLQNLPSCLGCWFFASLVFTAGKQKNLFLMILTLLTTSWIQTKQSS